MVIKALTSPRSLALPYRATLTRVAVTLVAAACLALFAAGLLSHLNQSGILTFKFWQLKQASLVMWLSLGGLLGCGLFSFTGRREALVVVEKDVDLKQLTDEEAAAFDCIIEEELKEGQYYIYHRKAIIEVRVKSDNKFLKYSFYHDGSSNRGLRVANLRERLSFFKLRCIQEVTLDYIEKEAPKSPVKALPVSPKRSFDDLYRKVSFEGEATPQNSWLVL